MEENVWQVESTKKKTFFIGLLNVSEKEKPSEEQAAELISITTDFSNLKEETKSHKEISWQ